MARSDRVFDSLSVNSAWPIKKIKVEEKLYEANSDGLLEILSELDDMLDTVVLLGHNPGLTDLVNLLSSVTIDNMPTCGVFVVEFAIRSWRKISQRPGTFILFDFPKNH